MKLSEETQETLIAVGLGFIIGLSLVVIGMAFIWNNYTSQL